MKSAINLAALLFFFLFVSNKTLAAESIFTEQELQWIAANPKLIIGYPSFEYPPYIVHNQRMEIEGIYQDFANIITEKTGIELQVNITSGAAELEQALLNGKVDIVAGFSPTEARKKQLDFSRAFLQEPRSLIVRADSNLPSKTTLASFDSTTFAQERSFSTIPELKAYLKSATILEVDNTLDAIAAVKYGLADAYYADQLTNHYLIESQTTQRLTLIELTDIAPDSSHYAILKGRDQLKSILNKVIQQIDGITYSSIIARWNSPKAHNQKRKLAVPLSEQENAWLEKRSALYYTSTTSFAPLSYSTNDGQSVEGLSIDLLQLVADKLGLALEYVPTDTKQQALAMLHEQEVDVFPFALNIGEDTFGTSLTDAYKLSPWVLIAGSKNENYNSGNFKQAAMRIANPRGYFSNTFIKKSLPNSEIVSANSMKEAIALLQAEKVDAIFSILSVASPLLQGKYTGDFKIINELSADKNVEISMAVDNNNPILLSLLNKTLAQTPQQEIDAIKARWLNYSINQGYDLSRLLVPAIIVSLIFIAVISFIIYWNRNLKLEIAQRAEAEQRALNAEQAAIESAKAKTDFLARMSHEIRTPMNGVLGMTEALNHTQLSNEQIDLLQTLQGSARNLMALLNDVLDFSKMDAGKIVFEEIPYALKDILNACIDNYRHKAQSSGIQLSCHIDQIAQTVFIGDPSRLTQVLNNLVSNAIKFTAEGMVERGQV